MNIGFYQERENFHTQLIGRYIFIGMGSGSTRVGKLVGIQEGYYHLLPYVRINFRDDLKTEFIIVETGTPRAIHIGSTNEVFEVDRKFMENYLKNSNDLCEKEKQQKILEHKKMLEDLAEE
jgi:hypothetical protein